MNIHLFASDGDTERVRSELAKGVPVDARDDRDLTPLACAVKSSAADSAMLQLLIDAGADVNASVDEAKKYPVGLAACSGSLDKVRLLADAGANVRFVSDSGYTVLIDISYRLFDREQLVPMIRLLTELGAETDRETKYSESALSVASRFGRFDAVSELLDAGADPTPLEWTALMKAVALGSVDDVRELLSDKSTCLDKRDRWKRSVWLLACVAGDIAKARTILEAGADPGDREVMGQTASTICATQGHSEILAWLLDTGIDIEATDAEENSALMLAAQAGESECVRLLLNAGADPARQNTYDECAMSMTSSEAVIRLLLEAGEDINTISSNARRELLGLQGTTPLKVSKAEYASGCRPRRGGMNPDLMNIPLWDEMVRSGISAYEAKAQFGDEGNMTEPTWCHSRFGVSFTELPDGRFVQTGGEHEDFYDPDFYIYNDVLIHERDGCFQILGYPTDVFPPTDFHTATYHEGSIYLVGGLGYQESRQLGSTPVYRLDCGTWKIEQLESGGNNPGWIYEHRTRLNDVGELVISGGKICLESEGGEVHIDNDFEFILDLSDGIWRRS